MKIAVLVSGNGSNLQALIDFALSGQIVGVISNKPDAFALQRAQSANIATRIIQHQDFPNRQQFDAQMHQQLIDWQVDVVVLAGFMRILSSDFVQAWQGKMLNIHPSLLPAYKGVNTHQRVINTGDVLHGCSVHFVTPELDAGPCIAQGILQVKHTDDCHSLANRIHQLEHVIYPQAVEWFCTGMVSYHPEQGISYRHKLLNKPMCFYQ